MELSAEFADRARHFCAFVARASEYTLDERVRVVRARLLDVYAAALDLPEVEAPEGAEVDTIPERPAEWPGFDGVDEYWLVFDPHEPSAPVACSLSDDVLDIFHDLRRGLDLWDEGERLAAVWEWKFHFEIHWGAHAVGALAALHRVALYGGLAP